MTATTLLVMWSGVSDWIKTRGRLSAEQIVERYAEISLRVVGFGIVAPLVPTSAP